MMARGSDNHFAAGGNFYLTWHLLLHIITHQKKISGRSADRYFFVHTINIYNRADDAVKRTRFFNSLVIKYQSAVATLKVADWQRIETITLGLVPWRERLRHYLNSSLFVIQ